MIGSLESGKRAAAIAAVDENVVDGQIIGIGSGSTIIYAVERIKERVQKEQLRVICVPTSFQASELITAANLTLSSLNVHPQLDIAIDGVDEIDPQFHCIKGGGGCLLQEKLIAANANKFVVIADERKKSVQLGEHWKKGIPIEVMAIAYVSVMNRLKKMGLMPVLRMAKEKAGPVVTDNGNLVLDTQFTSLDDPISLNVAIQTIPGVVETGLFCDMVNVAYFGHIDSRVERQQCVSN